MKWSEGFKQTLGEKGKRRYFESILWLFAAGFCIGRACNKAYRIGEAVGAGTIMDCSTPDNDYGSDFVDVEPM